jgi:hypothetical protein
MARSRKLHAHRITDIARPEMWAAAWWSDAVRRTAMRDFKMPHIVQK